jgi:hypothetical protein
MSLQNPVIRKKVNRAARKKLPRKAKKHLAAQKTQKTLNLAQKTKKLLAAKTKQKLLSQPAAVTAMATAMLRLRRISDLRIKNAQLRMQNKKCRIKNAELRMQSFGSAFFFGKTLSLP